MAKLPTFVAALGALRNGTAVEGLNETWKDFLLVLSQDDSTGGKGKGTLTLKLNVTVNRGLVEIEHEIITKEPKERMGKSILYLTPEGKLTTNDPAQPDLPLRDVAEPATRVI